MELLFYPLLLQFGIYTSNAKSYSENDVYTTNSSTTYSNIPSDCSLFGSKFETVNLKHKVILNVAKNGTYWIGAKIGYERNINPLGVQTACNSNRSGSLDECNIHCKDWKYFSYNENSCSCSNDYKAYGGLGKAEVCETPENGLCVVSKCVVYERNIVDNDFVCGAHLYVKAAQTFIFTTKRCSTKLSYVCNGDEPFSDSVNIKSSWLEAEHVCSKKEHSFIQNDNIGDEFNDGTTFWTSFFRRKKISWGIDTTKTVCVAATIQLNGSYQLETQFCNESLEALCHNPDLYVFSEAEIMTASFGSVLGGVLLCIVVVAATKHRWY